MLLLRRSGGGFTPWAWAAVAVALQGAVLAWVARPAQALVFAAGLAVGLLLHAAWLAELRRSDEEIQRQGEKP